MFTSGRTHQVYETMLLLIRFPSMLNVELKENDLKDYQSCEDDDHLQFKVLARTSVT
jgi:hypothetical protein